MWPHQTFLSLYEIKYNPRLPNNQYRKLLIQTKELIWNSLMSQCCHTPSVEGVSGTHYQTSELTNQPLD